MDNNSHIPLEEMLQDLKDTQKEIEQFYEEIDVLSKDRERNKLAIYINEGRIGQHRGFEMQLKRIIKETYPGHNLEE
jgi:hypothetical protein